MTAAIVSPNPAQQAHYEQMVAAGESPRLAEMLALGRSPYGKGTDRTFMEGRMGGEQFAKNPDLGNYYAEIAKAAGVDITGKQYQMQLADWPGDPTAWVGGVDDVKRVCREKNLRCQGAVDFRDTHERPPMPDIDVADDLVDDALIRAVDADPSLRERPFEEVRAEVKERVKPQPAPVPSRESFAQNLAKALPDTLE